MTINDASMTEKNYHFADWQFNPIDGLLYSKQKKLRLQPRLSQLLHLLVSNEGKLLSRKSLIDAIWQDKFVNEDALSRCIAELRAALGDNTSAPIYIETVPKKGYRFIQGVSKDPNQQSLKSVCPFYFKYGLFIALITLMLTIYVYQSVFPPTDQTQPIKSAIIAAQRLTSDIALEHQPALSNIEEMLAFSVVQERRLIIKVINTHNDLLYEIRDPQQHLVSPTFSPDDKSLLVAALVGETCTVYLYQLPSLQREKITPCMSPDPSSIFSWSANGEHIAYVNHSIDSEDSSSLKGAAIWLFDVLSKQHQPLTFPDNQHSYDTHPRFSPDGKHLAFTRGNGSIRNLFITQLAAKKTQGSPINLTEQGAMITGFSWLKNSHQLIFDSNVLGDRNLWLVDIDNKQTALLGARDAKFPSLNRNNSLLAFQEVRYNANIWQISLKDPKSASEPIIQSIKYNNFPSFSPDGKQVAFVSNRKGKAAIWLYSAATKKQSQLLAIEDADLILPNWSYDGSHLLVSSRDATGYRCYQINLVTKLYQPLNGVSQQHHGCQYSAAGDIFAISKQPSEKSTLIKITKNGNVTELSDFSIERLQTTQLNKVIYSLPKKNGLYSMDFNGKDNQLVVEGFDSQLNGHWTVQGDYLYYPKLDPDKGMWRRHINTGEEIKVTTFLPTAIGSTSAVSPNHTQLIYSQTDGRQADIYLTDFLPNN